MMNIDVNRFKFIAEVMYEVLRKEYEDKLDKQEYAMIAQRITTANFNLIKQLTLIEDEEEVKRKVINITRNYIKLNTASFSD